MLETDSTEEIIFEAWAQVLLANSKVKGSEEYSQRKRLQVAVGKLAKEIEFIRESYQINRKRLDGKMMQHLKTALAYHASFHLPNAYRIASIVDRINLDLSYNCLQPLGESPCIYDLGCGTGALASGLLTKMNKPDLAQVFLFDSNRHLLKLAEDNIKAISPNTKPKSIRINLQDLDPMRNAPRDHNTGAVYLLGYVWNEIQKNTRSLKTLQRLFESVVSSVKPIKLIVLEPATDVNWSTAKRLRNQLVETGFHINYPCPHELECPLQGKDRCYSEINFKVPDIYKQLENQQQQLFRNKLATTAFSFVNKAYLKETQALRKPNRYVGFPLNNKEQVKTFYTLSCTQEGQIKKQEASATSFTKDKKLRCSAVD